MKLTTVLGSVNLNPEYYLFIPKQIKFWAKHNIKFIAILIGNKIPKELEPYTTNIILWKHNNEINNVFLSQHLRIYYPALLNLPDDELCMITDMDMLPININYYTDDLEKYNIEDFIYYRDFLGNQIIICYNAAHPQTWSKVFNIKTEEDIVNRLYETYSDSYEGKPDGNKWSFDQEIMYKTLINYPSLKILRRPIKRLEKWTFLKIIRTKNKTFDYNDIHFHRSFKSNQYLISVLERLLNIS